jgi:hypothetical protein
MVVRIGCTSSGGEKLIRIKRSKKQIRASDVSKLMKFVFSIHEQTLKFPVLTNQPAKQSEQCVVSNKRPWQLTKSMVSLPPAFDEPSATDT